MTADRDTYDRCWYSRNKLRINDVRRKRYAHDQEYADKCRKRAREYRRKMRPWAIAEGERTKGVGGSSKSRSDQFVVVVDGVRYRGWTIRRLAVVTERSMTTVNNWHRKGMIPATPLRTARGTRVYTDLMIRVVFDALVIWGGSALRANRDHFFEYVSREWWSTGVFGGGVVVSEIPV